MPSEIQPSTLDEHSPHSSPYNIVPYFEKILIPILGEDDYALQINPDGTLRGINGDSYVDSPHMRKLIRIATSIIKTLPAIPVGYVRLWRGNRPSEVGMNPSYTNSLEAIALPFLISYQGVLSYIDVTQEAASGYVNTGPAVRNAEFTLPKDLVRRVHIVGMSDEEAETLKTQSKQEKPEPNRWEVASI